MADATCVEAGCTSEVSNKSRQLCRRHYKQLWLANTDRRCSVDGCDSAHESHGLCNTHNYRRRNGLPLDAPITRNKGKICDVAGCNDSVLAKELCRLHYHRKLMTGTTDLRPVVKRFCSVEGCEEPHAARDLCGKHYQRLTLKGSTDDRPEFVPSTCSIDGCADVVLARNWCRSHYARWMRSGSPYPLVSLKKRCVVEKCTRKYKTHGLCLFHWRRSETPRVVEVRKVRERSRGCSVDRCPERHACRGMCVSHYQKWYRQQYGADVNARRKERRVNATSAEVVARKAARAAGYQANRETIRARAQARYLERYAADPAPWRAAKARRRTRRLAAMSRTDIRMSEEYRRATAGDPCFYCGNRPATHVDHFFPLAKGGTDHWWNLRRACQSCNMSKHARCGTWFALRGSRATRLATSLTEADPSDRSCAQH